MVELKNLANELEERLNDSEYMNEINALFERIKFEFRIVLDTAEYQPPKRIDNEITYYIHALMTREGSEVEGTESQTYTANVKASIEFLIPMLDAVGDDGTKALLEKIMTLLENELQTQIGSEEKYGGDEYYVSKEYSIGAIGKREVRKRVGDSVTITVLANYFFVPLGIASDDIVIKVNGENVYPLRHGISRRSINEGNVSSDDADGSAKNTPGGTALVLSFEAPLRKGAFDKSLTEYSLTGKFSPLSVGVTIPTVSGNLTDTYTMIFDNVGINGETSLAASYSCVLVEYLEKNKSEVS